MFFINSYYTVYNIALSLMEQLTQKWKIALNVLTIRDVD